MLSETPAAEPYGVSFRDLLESVPKTSLTIHKAPIHTQGSATNNDSSAARSQKQAFDA